MAETSGGVIPGGGPGSGYMKKWGIIGLSAGLFALALALLVLLWCQWPVCTPAAPATTGTEETATTEPASSDLSTPSEPTSDLASSDLTLGTDLTPPPAAELEVTGVSPATGDTAGGTSVEILGTGFTDKASVLFDETEATVTSVRPTAILATTPAHAEGVVAVSVKTDSGTVSLRRGFTYQACPGEHAILLLVLIAGALGGTLHAILSFYWYVGNRELKRSWVPMYAFLPITGAALACVFFLCISGGIINSQNPSNRLWIVGLAALIGLFSEQGFEKLKKIFEALFTSVPPAADKPQIGATTIAINPANGPQAGGTVVKITGTGFITGTTVEFGAVQSAAVQVESPTTLSATTPAAAATGAVDVTVTIPGGPKVILPGGFTYQ